jgi:hypothetical protein
MYKTASGSPERGRARDLLDELARVYPETEKEAHAIRAEAAASAHVRELARRTAFGNAAEAADALATLRTDWFLRRSLETEAARNPDEKWLTAAHMRVLEAMATVNHPRSPASSPGFAATLRSYGRPCRPGDVRSLWRRLLHRDR